MEVNQGLPPCGRDVTRTCNCRVRERSVLIFESYARVYDTHATFHMIPAHGTYVALHLLRERERAYLQTDNKKKQETSVESSNPIKGDDPWLTFRTRLQRAASSRTNQNVSAPAFSAGWQIRFMCRASARSSARS